MNRLQNFKEMVIVYGTMTGLFLPIRFFFVTYVSDNWLGSFGLISAVSILIFVLTMKNKLGVFGQMFKRQMNTFHNGKLGKLILFYICFLLIFFGSLVFSIEMGNSYYSEIKEELLLENTHISDYGLVIEQVQESTVERLVLGAVLSFFVFIFEFPMFSAALAIINDIFDGWILHFYTVAFVENLEVLLIMIVFKLYIMKNRFYSKTNFIFYNKLKSLKNWIHEGNILTRYTLCDYCICGDCKNCMNIKEKNPNTVCTCEHKVNKIE